MRSYASTARLQGPWISSATAGRCWWCELLLRRGCRYKDLQAGLLGISTNVLTERLRDLVGARGCTACRSLVADSHATLRADFPRDRAGPLLHALGRWGTALMAAPQGDDAFRGHWLAFPISRLTDSAPNDPPVTVQVPAES
jgi:hypothetical protein